MRAKRRSDSFNCSGLSNRNSTRVYFERFSQIVVPRAARLGLLPQWTRNYCNHGAGPFVDEISTICYCLCYGPTHFTSFVLGLDAVDLHHNRLPRRPLLVDIGCGPGTALFSLGEWLHRHRDRPSDIRYIGIDSSAPMREIAAEFAADAQLFREFQPVLLPSLDDGANTTIERAMHDRDGVIVMMSYVLHQGFMESGRTLLEVLRRMSGEEHPVFLLGQDANKQLREDKVEIWPETRLRRLLNEAEQFGYRSDRVWTERVNAPWQSVDEAGVVAEADGTTKTLAYRAQLR